MVATLMKAVEVPRAGADFKIVERKIPEPGPGQVRIKVQACGVCHRAAEAYARMISGNAQFRVVLTA